MKLTLRQLQPETKQSASSSICAIIQQWILSQPDLTTIASFAPLSIEPNLLPLHTLLPDLRIVYPLITGHGTMRFYQVGDITTLKPGPFELKEPRPDLHPVVDTRAIQLFLCPAYAYTDDGNRLGKGGGFYDRALANASPSATLLGVAFSCQILQKLPHQPHDIRVHRVISD